MSQRRRNVEPAPLVANAGRLGQVQRAEELEQLLRDNQLADLRAVLATEPGRRLIWRLLVEEGGLFQQTFREGRPDTSAFFEGKRSIALFVQAEIGQADPTAFERMRAERASDDALEDAVRRSVAEQADDDDAD
jgi:hypothetical protein